jgi:hypothetical protein
MFSLVSLQIISWTQNIIKQSARRFSFNIGKSLATHPNLFYNKNNTCSSETQRGGVKMAIRMLMPPSAASHAKPSIGGDTLHGVELS